MAPLRIGLIGCGAFARRYHIPALSLIPGVRTPWICDKERTPPVEDAARRLGAHIVDSVSPLYGSDGCDAVIISLPHTLHYAFAMEAIAAGRHVLMDKPLTTRSSEARQLAAAAADAGLVAAVAFNRRFDPSCLRAREIVRSGGIGKLGVVEATQLGYDTGWVLDPELGGGGMFWGRGTHMADLVPWLTDATPVRVRAKLYPGPPGRTDLGGLIDIGFEGFDCRITCAETGFPGFDELRVFGDLGRIELRRPQGRLLGWAMDWERVGQGPAEHLDGEELPGAATEDFINAITTGTPPACSFVAGVMSVRTIEAAFRSAEEGQRWLAFDAEIVSPVVGSG